jgi:hypothetical protein
MQPITILLFGDQTASFAPVIRELHTTARQSSYFARKFLREALDVVSKELRKLPSAARNAAQLDDEIFAALLSDPEAFEAMEDPMGIYQTVLTCVARLGELIL